MNVSLCWYEPVNEILAFANNQEKGKIQTFFFNEKRSGMKYKGPDFQIDYQDSQSSQNQEGSKVINVLSNMFSTKSVNFQAVPDKRNCNLNTENRIENENKIYLVNLYRKTYLIYLNGYLGKIYIYHLSFDKVSKQNFQISVPSDNNISICIVDNLIVIHSHNENMSMVYDVKRHNASLQLGPPCPIVI